MDHHKAGRGGRGGGGEGRKKKTPKTLKAIDTYRYRQGADVHLLINMNEVHLSGGTQRAAVNFGQKPVYGVRMLMCDNHLVNRMQLFVCCRPSVPGLESAMATGNCLF